VTPKIASIVLGFVTAIALALLDYAPRWKDPTSKLHKATRWVVKLAVVAALGFGIWGAVEDDRASTHLTSTIESTSKDVTAGFDNTKKELAAAQESLAAARRDLTDTRAELTKTREELAGARGVLDRIAEKIGVGVPAVSHNAEQMGQLILRELDDLKKRALLLEDKSIDLERQVKPRELTAAERAAIVEAAGKVGGLPSLSIHVSSADAEAQVYGRHFQAAFRDAGLDIKGLNMEAGGAIVTAKGLVIAIPPQAKGTRAPPQAQRLAAVLSQAGLKYEVLGWPGLTGDDLRLVVGRKL